jgi:hypothetical protein
MGKALKRRALWVRYNFIFKMWGMVAVLSSLLMMWSTRCRVATQAAVSKPDQYASRPVIPPSIESVGG